MESAGSWTGQDLIFVGGHPRSGTTFLGRLLGAHPAIVYCEEPSLLDLGDRLGAVMRPTIERLLADAAAPLVESRRNVALREQFGGFDPAAVDARVGALVLHALHGICRDLRQQADAAYVLDKTPGQLLRFEETAERLPAALFIDIVRDPRDIACSMVEWTERWGRPPWLPPAEDDVEAVAKQWVAYIEAGDRALARAPGQVLRLDYRALMNDPRGVIEPVLTRLALPWVPALDAFLASGMGGLDPSRLGRWRRELPEPARQAVASIAGSHMARLGFDPRPVG